MTEEFSVAQFFADDTCEYVGRGMAAEEAVILAKRCTQSVGARRGMVRRIVITDAGDCCCFEWRYGRGVTFPPRGRGGKFVHTGRR